MNYNSGVEIFPMTFHAIIIYFAFKSDLVFRKIELTLAVFLNARKIGLCSNPKCCPCVGSHVRHSNPRPECLFTNLSRGFCGSHTHASGRWPSSRSSPGQTRQSLTLDSHLRAADNFPDGRCSDLLTSL
jgi:hypothetical protein